MSARKWNKLTPDKEYKLLKKGYLFIKWKDSQSPVGPIPQRILNLVRNELPREIQVAAPANFILTNHQKPVYAVVNGFWIDLLTTPKPITNSMGY